MTTPLDAPRAARASRKQGPGDPAQLGLFDALTPNPIPDVVVEATVDIKQQGSVSRAVTIPRSEKSAPRPSVGSKWPDDENPAKGRRRRVEPEIRTLSEADMPSYPAGLVAAIDQSLQDLPTDRVWLTYRDIQDYFGVSRATVARRVKEGLVPRVRLQEGRVLDDGSVRRFDRVQVRWILLAVQSRTSRSE
jgi:hypothetical protein